MPDRDVAIDLEAIREDIALAARSSEMARHVALDHGPELIAEVERLRQQRTITTVEELDELPVRTLIGYVDNSRIFRRYWTSDDGDSEHFWQEPGGYSYRSREIPLPAIALWLPEWGNK